MVTPMIWSILILLVVSLVAAFLAKMLGPIARMLLGLAGLVTFLYLLGIWATLFNVTVLSDLIARIPGLMYIVSVSAGLMLGGLVGDILPLP